jgi:hypothetical protein
MLAARKVPQHGSRVDWYAAWLAEGARADDLQRRLNFERERADNLETELNRLRDELYAEIQRIGLAMIQHHGKE